MGIILSMGVTYVTNQTAGVNNYKKMYNIHYYLKLVVVCEKNKFDSIISFLIGDILALFLRLWDSVQKFITGAQLSR
jgi:hypothetical protein